MILSRGHETVEKMGGWVYRAIMWGGPTMTLVFLFINFHFWGKYKVKVKNNTSNVTCTHHCGTSDSLLIFILRLLFLFLQRRHSPWWAATRERRQPSVPHQCPVKPKCSQPAPSMLHGFLRLQQNYFDTTVTCPQGDREDGCQHTDGLP